MADEKTNASSEMDELAFDIYAKRLASGARNSAEVLAVESYRQAEAFVKIRGQVRKGELKPAAAIAKSMLADCCAPNLPHKTHPHNMVSQRFGDPTLERVNRIKRWLDANPTPESEPEELLARLNAEFTDLAWTMPTVNVARAIFPTYCKN